MADTPSQQVIPIQPQESSAALPPPCATCPYANQEKTLELKKRIWGESFKEFFIRAMFVSLGIIFALTIVTMGYMSITGKDLNIPQGANIILNVVQDLFLALTEFLK